MSDSEVNIGDIVFATYTTTPLGISQESSHKVPAIITSVRNKKDENGNQLVNVTVFNDSHKNGWYEDVSLYKGSGPTDSEKIRFKQGLYLTEKI